jgi:hypothetical protein
MGLINLSTNVISGAQYGVYIATQGVGARILIASNTVNISTSPNNDTYGIYLNGLATGATIYNNGLYYRAAGSIGARATYGLYAKSAGNFSFHHNRISQPGMILAGSVISAYFAGSADTSFKFNDVNSTGTGLATAYLLQLVNSTVTLRNNVFLSSWTVSVASANLALNAASGVDSDYNDWFSSSSGKGFVWGATAAALSGWQALGKDANSFAAHPLWFNVSGGVEDFHPMSSAGRWQNGAWIGDGADAQTIDAGDPAETTAGNSGHEPSPNGCLPNLGSFGQTDEASKSAQRLSVLISTDYYNFSSGGAISLALSTVSVSSVVVINNGNTNQYYQIAGTTITQDSIWVLSTAAGSERPVLQALFQSAQPAQADFASSNYVTDQARTCSAGYYNGSDQNCADAAPYSATGAGLGLWFKLTPPTNTIYNNVPQTIKVTITAGSGAMCSD